MRGIKHAHLRRPLSVPSRTCRRSAGLFPLLCSSNTCPLANRYGQPADTSKVTTSAGRKPALRREAARVVRVPPDRKSSRSYPQRRMATARAKRTCGPQRLDIDRTHRRTERGGVLSRCCSSWAAYVNADGPLTAGAPLHVLEMPTSCQAPTNGSVVR